jgi:acetyl-CoA C-acetyltransferase
LSIPAYLYDAVRTPRARGKPNGGLHLCTPLQLVTVLLETLARKHPALPAIVDEVILGCCEQFNDQGGNLARSAVLQAAFPEHVPGLMVSRFCGSALDAVNTVATKVMAGQLDLALAGGVEMLSLVSIFGSGGPMATDFTFRDQTSQIPQGLAADLIATRQGYSRTDVDALAAASQQRACHAWKEGWFESSVVPVATPTGILAKDETVRENVTVESLAGLPPAFARAGEEGYRHVLRFRYPEVGSINYVHHAGNSSGIADGAAVVLIGSRQAGEQLGLRPRARIIATATAADDPCIMLTAPAAAAEKALRRVKLAFEDVDLYEVNEAFASVVLYFLEKTGVPLDRTNVAGGAIAMGHPVGATGAILIGTLLDEMQRRQVEHGVVTMCTGLGMGVATVLRQV